MLNWYLQSGNESDVVYSTRIRLARNIKGISFVNRYTKEDAIKIIELMENAINNLGYGLKLIRLKNLDDITKLSLVEKHLISPEFAYNKNEIGAIAINDDENICIMINEEDHLRIQVLSAGLELENSLNLAMEIDKKLEEIIQYAYNNKYGFLTSCPTNVGTGLRASIMVHLPALSKTRNIRKVLEAVNSFDMNIRGIYGEGSKVKGDIYQISNKQSLGISEEEIIKNLKVITDKVIEQEKLARKILTKKGIELEGNVDAIVFTAGVGENGADVRSAVIKRLNCLGITLDEEFNSKVAAFKDIHEGKISASDSKVDVYVVPTDEEVMIVRDTYQLIKED